MMTKDEADSVFAKLSSIIQRTPFAWILKQVTDEISIGKLEAKKVKVTSAEDVEGYLLPIPESGRRKKTEMFTGTIQFSSHEKLDLLVNALEKVTCDVADMYNDASKMLQLGKLHGSQTPVTVQFEFKNEENMTSIKCNNDAKNELLEKTESLRPLLGELKGNLNATAS